MMDHYAWFYRIFCLSVWKYSTCCGLFSETRAVYHLFNQKPLHIPAALTKRQHCKWKVTFSKDLDLRHDRQFPDFLTKTHLKREKLCLDMKQYSVFVRFILSNCFWNTSRGGFESKSIWEIFENFQLVLWSENQDPASISFGEEPPQRFIYIRELHLLPYTDHSPTVFVRHEKLGNDGRGWQWSKAGQWGFFWEIRKGLT